jgi:4-alpha-glucanotransferase
MVLVNLEDLWGEMERQNLPGTTMEQPNWRRKGRYSFEEFSTMPGVVEALEQLAEARRGSGPGR